MAILKQRAQIACEIEAEEGTAETLEAADAFLCFDPHFTPGIVPYERNPVRSDLSWHPSVFGKRSGTITFSVELVGGNAGDAIHFSDALQACGIDETLVGSTSATYTPLSTGVPSVTMALYMDGKIYKIWGARGNATLILEAGKPGIFEMEFIGADFSEADGAMLSGVSYNDTKPPTFQSATMTIDSFAAIVQRIELEFGNTNVLRPSVNASSGNLSCLITARKPMLNFDPENDLVANEDFLGNWRSGAEMAFAASLGSVAGNTIGITAPKVQYQEIGMSDREGISMLEAKGLCCRNTGDDEWQIQIT